jgi:hypothetical protein
MTMAMFIVIPTTRDVGELEDALADMLLVDHYRLPNGEWLVSFDGTPEELSTALEMASTSAGGRALVFVVERYFGFAPANAWAWIKAKWGVDGLGARR